jgi:hypothetical protein
MWATARRSVFGVNMSSRVLVQSVTVLRGNRAGALIAAVLCLGCFAPTAAAKEPSLTAIELYDGPNGAAYVQLTDVLINGKAEMRDCTAFQSAAIDKSTYGKMEKLALGSGGVLERGADGALRYTVNHGAPSCVAPWNVKYEHDAAYTLSELADRADLRAAPTAAQPLKKGVKLVFIDAPNVELAEFLRAQRASDIPGWQAYLGKYPSSPHTAEAKPALALLFAEAGETAVAAYDKTAATAAPSYPDLKTAKDQSQQAHAVSPGAPPLAKLDSDIRARLDAITARGRGELNAYHEALNSHAEGYVHLKSAKSFSDTIAGIDPGFAPGQALLADVMVDSNALQAAIESAESASTAKQFDQAMTSIQPYRAFREEEPRIAAVIDGGYGYHFAKGKQAEQVPDWPGAIKEYQRAATMKDTAEVQDALKNAQAQLVITEDKAAADKAEASSKDYEQQKNIILAYESLANLPAGQRKLVVDDIERLKSAYVLSAQQKAKELRQAHDPIKGIEDEIQIENAYNYLKHAYELSENDSYRDRMDLLGNDLSKWFLDRAKFYLAKPAGSGTELGWKYLSEALPYKADNLDDIRDTMTAAAAAHVMRSKLSIRVQFRDQTSQGGFAPRLENAIITGLESSGVPVKVVRAGETTAVEPDFELTGDVLQHRLSAPPTVEPMESKYREGVREVPNDKWNDANRVHEKATMDLQTAQAALQGAEAAKRGKKEIEDLSASVAGAEKTVQEASTRLDAIPKTVPQDVERPYTYYKKTININGVIQMQFRVADSFSGQTPEPIPASKELSRQYVVLDGVKSEDTMGIKATAPAPDPAELMTDLENSALEALIDAARKRVDELPKTIYNRALGRENEGDLDSAGESYLRFLNVTKENGSPERVHAARFLLEQFNMRPDTASAQ